MARPLFLKGEAEFRCDGEPYRIVLNNTAWLAIEDLVPGLSLIDLTHQLLNSMIQGSHLPVKVLAPVLAAGLLEDRPETTLEDATAMILSLDQQPVLTALHQAMLGSLPLTKSDKADEEEETEGNGQSPADGTGKRSSRAGAAPGKGSKTSGKPRRG